MKAILTIAGIVFIVAGIGVGAASQFDMGTALIGLNLGLGATLLVGGFLMLGLGAIAGSLAKMAGDLGSSSVSSSPDYITRDKSVGGLGAGAAAGIAGAAGATGAVIGSQYEKAADGVDKAIDKVAEAAENAKDTALDAGKAVKDTTGDALKAVKETTTETAENAVDAVKETSGNVAGSFASSFDKAKQAAKETTKDVVETTTGTTEKAVDALSDAVEPKADQTKAGVEETAEEINATPERDVAEEAGDEVGAEELYVVEELVIRGKQARILSDQTVEAETNEGWMRFENVEHLEEYVDATEG